MLKRRSGFDHLPESYLFPEVQRRKEEFLAAHPGVSLISLGIGDTVLPLPKVIAEAMGNASLSMSTEEGYRGYGLEQGSPTLREQIASRFYPEMSAEEIFVTDGSKSDLARLQAFFGSDVSIALQDPTYPVYLEGSLIQEVKNIHLLPCTKENDFVCPLPEGIDLLYLCNPNNPTGKVMTFEELERIIEHARKFRYLILYDGAYAGYIQDQKFPRTIYDIPGADEVAIEVNSFSKLAGFTGIRLGWTVIPKRLSYSCGRSLWKDLQRQNSITFNGASYLSQVGGMAALEEEGWKGIQQSIAQTMQNAHFLKKLFQSEGFEVFGGDNAPYLWIHTPKKKGWDLFQDFLEERHLIVTPGVGFGACGEHYFRVSAFGRPSAIHQLKRGSDGRVSARIMELPPRV
ncbi:MAG: LL-diaminopimelate aminotransferase [Chlamydiia bacterium]|nr:LL-diaminopimelate aminotransferase [Chlamydiia bacterium]